MSSVSSIRLPGLATGMDTEAMVKSMLTGEQNKIDKAQQKEQTIKWQQEIYREVISEATSLNDKYFSLTSKNSIVSSSAWNTLTVNSSNSSVITAEGSAGANDINYKFVTTQATAAKATSNKLDVSATTSLRSLKYLRIENETLAIKTGVDKDGKDIYSSIDIYAETTYKKRNNLDGLVESNETDKDGNKIFIDEQSGEKFDSKGIKLDKDGNKVVEHEADTISSLVSKINQAANGALKASYSEMTGEFTLESSTLGNSSEIKIGKLKKEDDGKETFVESDLLNKLGLKFESGKDGSVEVYEAKVEIDPTTNKPYNPSDLPIREINGINTNEFIIDGITYTVNGSGISTLTSTKSTDKVVENMNAFIEDYNKLMDKIYTLVTEKTNSDYPPLTEAQKEEMSEDEIEKWEKKAKVGILRNDSEMRRFMDNMQNAIFGDNMKYLNSIGLTSHENYNNKGQLALDEDKFIKALETNGEKVYQAFAGDKNSVFEKMKTTMKNYVGGSSSIFAKKAGLEKTASFTNNYYSEQLKKQADFIKNLQNKMYDKETELYKKFGNLESSMNKLNSQMNYFMSQA